MTSTVGREGTSRSVAAPMLRAPVGGWCNWPARDSLEVEDGVRVPAPQLPFHPAWMGTSVRGNSALHRTGGARGDSSRRLLGAGSPATRNARRRREPQDTPEV